MNSSTLRPWRSAGLALALASFLASITTPLNAADPDTLNRLDQLLKTAVTYTYGKDAAPLLHVEQIVVRAATQPDLRTEVEARLLQALEPNTSRDAREFICRQLFTIATPRAVPKLETLLLDPELSHMARFVLGRMEDPSAGEALRRALPKTTGAARIGILHTLAARRDQAVVPDLVSWLTGNDAALAQAAAIALGNIGGTRAAAALKAARAQADPELQRRIDEALLQCADQFVADGQPTEAAALYESFYASHQPKHYRIGALRGLAVCNGAGVASLVGEAIADSDPEVRASAIALIPSVSGIEATRRFVALLPNAPPEVQELLIRALTQRGDRAAAPALLVAAQGSEPAPRLAALEGLGTLGDREAVAVLAKAAATSGRDQQVARASLVRLPENVNGRILNLLSTAEPKVQVELLRALAGRRVHGCVSQLWSYARHSDRIVRHEAITALGALASGPETQGLIKLAFDPKAHEDRAAFEEAILAALRRVESMSDRAALILPSLAAAPNAAKPTLLRTLVLANTPEAVYALCQASRDSNPACQEAALRTLAEWPDPTPADDLLQLARSTQSPALKAVALRGYVRMAGQRPDPAEAYLRALDLAQTPEDKKLVLAGLAGAESINALGITAPFLRQPDLQAEAGLAMVQIAGRLRQKEPAECRAAVKQVLSAVKDERVRKPAQELLNEMEQFEGYILNWQVAGPYKEKGKASRAIFDMPFPPETGDPEKTVTWKPLNRGVGSWDIQLENMFGSEDHCAAYLRTRVWAPAAQTVRLELGSDDAVKAWLNGKLIHAHYTNRGLSPRQDLAPATLQPGWNNLLLKVVDHEGPWGACCRIRNSDGSAVEGLRAIP